MAKGLQTRDRILDTAFKLAARDGLDGLSLSALAGELGLSKSGLFAHFTSKEELQLEMLRVASQRFVEQVMEPAFRRPRGLPRLKALFDQWSDWMTSLPPNVNPREEVVRTLRPVPVTGNAGDFIIWHQALPHCAAPAAGTYQSSASSAYK